MQVYIDKIYFYKKKDVVGNSNYIKFSCHLCLDVFSVVVT